MREKISEFDNKVYYTKINKFVPRDEFFNITTNSVKRISSLENGFKDFKKYEKLYKGESQNLFQQAKEDEQFDVEAYDPIFNEPQVKEILHKVLTYERPKKKRKKKDTEDSD